MTDKQLHLAFMFSFWYPILLIVVWLEKSLVRPIWQRCEVCLLNSNQSKEKLSSNQNSFLFHYPFGSYGLFVGKFALCILLLTVSMRNFCFVSSLCLIVLASVGLTYGMLLTSLRLAWWQIFWERPFHLALQYLQYIGPVPDLWYCERSLKRSRIWTRECIKKANNPLSSADYKFLEIDSCLKF